MRSLRTAIKAFVLASAPISAPAGAAVMTFEPLGPNNFAAEIHSYTEDGITLDAGTQHFHALSDGNGGTMATLFQIDGFPETLTFNGGATFDLTSIDIVSFGGGILPVFTSSSGKSVLVTTTGTYTFDSSFKGIDFVTLDSADFNTTGAGAYSIDNIVVNVATAIPESSTWLMMLVGLGAIGVSSRRRRKARSAPSC